MQNKNNLNGIIISFLKDASWILGNALPLLIAALIYYVLDLEVFIKLNEWLYPDASFFLFWWYLGVLIKNLKNLSIYISKDSIKTKEIEMKIYWLFITLVFLFTVCHLVLYILVRLNAVDGLFTGKGFAELPIILYISLSIMFILQFFTYYFQFRSSLVKQKSTGSFKLGLNSNAQINVNL